VEALRRVAAGGTVIDPKVVRRLFAHRRSRRPLEQLTAREREVLAPMESAACVVAAEALANVVEHSGATRAWISVRAGGGRLHLEIGTTAPAVPTRTAAAVCSV